MLPKTFFLNLAQIFEAAPTGWDASSWTHVGDSLRCEWRIDGEDGGVWGMDCGRNPQIVRLTGTTSSTSGVAGSGSGAGTWRLCFLQIHADDLIDLVSGKKNPNKAVFDKTLKLAGDIESLPLLNIALSKIMESGAAPM